MLYVYQHLILSVCHNILLFLGRLQFPAHNDQHGNEACGSPDEIGYGLREKNTIYGRDIQRGRSMVRGATITTFLRMEKKDGIFGFPKSWNTVCPENCRDIIKKPK